MTREEAIEYLNTIGQYYSQDHSDPYEDCEKLTKDELDALYMAIKALEQEPCGDAISRQIISDYVQSHIQEINTGYGDLNKHTNEILRMIVDYIESMPPVNPQPKLCDDAIDRVEAIKIASGYCHPANIPKELAKLPPVTPEPRWIPVSERLPEENIAVLVWCPERKNIYCAYLDEDQWWIFGAYLQKVTFDVIAWMPLPTPYKPNVIKLEAN